VGVTVEVGPGGGVLVVDLIPLGVVLVWIGRVWVEVELWVTTGAVSVEAEEICVVTVEDGPGGGVLVVDIIPLGVVLVWIGRVWVEVELWVTTGVVPVEAEETCVVAVEDGPAGGVLVVEIKPLVELCGIFKVTKLLQHMLLLAMAKI
jgi:hypothetical protein